jgi:transcriptional regulator with XRE-family HTH domain
MYAADMAKIKRHKEPPETTDIDLNQVVAYNVREARLLRGWTQEDLAAQLERFIGQRLTQAGISSIERAWDGDRRRVFDAHELLVFAMVFDLPIIYFLLPPPGDGRRLAGTSRYVEELYNWVMGKGEQTGPVYQRLRELGHTDPTPAEQRAERFLGTKSETQKMSFKERRKEMLIALLDDHADNFDKDIEELGRIVEHLREVGLRGYVAEKTRDEDFTYPGSQPPDIPPEVWEVEDETAPTDTREDGE